MWQGVLDSECYIVFVKINVEDYESMGHYFLTFWKHMIDNKNLFIHWTQVCSYATWGYISCHHMVASKEGIQAL